MDSGSVARINCNPVPRCAWCRKRLGLAACPRCEAVDRAWRQAGRQRQASGWRPFFRGFLVGSQDPRQTGDGLNPYQSGAARRRWQQGHTAGANYARAVHGRR